MWILAGSCLNLAGRGVLTVASNEKVAPFDLCGEFCGSQRQLGPSQYVQHRFVQRELVRPSVRHCDSPVSVHATSHYSPAGELPPRQGDEYPRPTGANAYAGLMIDKGYAVAYTRRPASGARRRGSISQASEEVRLDDGTVFKDKTFGFHTGLIRDWTQIAKNLVETRLGRQPERTYYYGKSGGASL